jgi:hypothetical protein
MNPILQDYKDSLAEARKSIINSTPENYAANLEEYSAKLNDWYSSVVKFDPLPVDIESFLDERSYLGKYFGGELLSDEKNYWRLALKDIFPSINYSPYWLVCLKGAIGVGKTTTASVGALYDLQWLLCNPDPQGFLGSLPAARIEFAIFNITLSATDVIWDKIASMMAESDYFTGLMGKAKKRFKTDTLFPKRIDFFSGSRIGHSLGRDVYEVIIDEANFEVITGQVRKTFYSLFRRMETRFMRKEGGFPGRIWIISSETDKSSVLNSLIEEYRGQEGVFIRQPAVWDVKPEKYAGDKRFKVFTGSILKPNPVIVDQTNESLFKEEQELIIEVPEKHKHDFETDVNGALRDLAGVSTFSRYKLFKQRDKLDNALCMELLFPDNFELDFNDDNDQIMNKTLIPDYFEKVYLPSFPRYLHIDIGLTGDRLGFGCTYISQYKEIRTRNILTFDEVTVNIPEIVAEFAFAIQSKTGQQIPLFKVRAFILWLAKRGYSFGCITADGYESADCLQMLKRVGFNTEEISVDKTSAPYLKLRAQVSEEHIFMPDSKLLRAELEDLEVSPDGKKVDHPEGKRPDGSPYSKDMADGICGSVFNLFKNSDKNRMAYFNPSTTPSEISKIMETFWPGEKGINV